MSEHPSPNVDSRRDDADASPDRETRTAGYWEIDDVAAPPPPMIDKPDPILVAIITDDEHIDSTERGGPHFVGAGTNAAPVGPPGLSADRVESAPVTRRTRTRLTRVLVLLLLGAGAYVAYPYVHAKIIERSVAADLRPYVAGAGVTYAPVGGGYSVRLPMSPTRRDPQLAAPTIPLTIAAHASIVTGTDYKIVVVVGDLPGGVMPKGVLGGLKDPKIGGPGTLTGAHPVQLAGEAAYVGTFVSSDALPRRVAVLIHGGRLYVIRVQAQSAGTVFSTLTKSFRFTVPG